MRERQTERATFRNFTLHLRRQRETTIVLEMLPIQFGSIFTFFLMVIQMLFCDLDIFLPMETLVVLHVQFNCVCSLILSLFRDNTACTPCSIHLLVYPSLSCVLYKHCLYLLSYSLACGNCQQKSGLIQVGHKLRNKLN